MNKEMFVGIPGAKRWRAMMNRDPGAGRYVHVSNQASMKDGRSIVSRGVTFDAGRNAAKRAARAMVASWAT